MDREADYGLQGAVGGRREVQAGEMLFFFVIWDSRRVLRSLWVNVAIAHVTIAQEDDQIKAHKK